MADPSQVLEALEASIPGLRQTASERGWRQLREREFQRALEAATGRRSAALVLQQWPRVGRVDLQLDRGTALELKWAIDDNTLCNCAWDVAKLGAAIAGRKLQRGYLVAGAPDTLWNTRQTGTELLDTAEYHDPLIVSRYERWWRFWCRDVKTQPLELPRVIATIDAGRVSAVLEDEPFTLRLTEVLVPDPGWEVFHCPHAARGEACGPRH
jgi:hypothetical protein